MPTQLAYAFLRRVATVAASLALLSAGLSAAPAVAQTDGPTRLLRFPDLHEDFVVFTYAGDLWRASIGGGNAVRLTSHPGLELFAKISPDGKWIAFTGQYGGDEQVYIMPAEGGAPQQLTYYPAIGPLPPRWGYDNQVNGWSPDGKKVLFRSLRDAHALHAGRLYIASIEGGLPEALPMPVAGSGNFSADGTKVFYSPRFRDFRTWKRYQGGTAQDLYVFDLADGSERRVTDGAGTERDPMWVGDNLIYASDESGVLNLMRRSVDGGKARPLTSFTDWDARWPSDDGRGRIVYEKNGRLEIIDLATGETATLDIRVSSEALALRPERSWVGDKIEDYGLSPRGSRAVFAARGDIFTVPTGDGVVRNLTQSPGAHDRSPDWSADGRTIAFITDASGEEELWTVAHHGRAAARVLAKGFGKRLTFPRWSPDGARIAIGDVAGRLYSVDAERGTYRLVDEGGRGTIGDFTWSPDGRYLAYSTRVASGMRSIHIWDDEERELRVLGAPEFDEFEPVWHPGGDYLFYLSDRSYAPRLSADEWDYATDRRTGIFALALRKDVPALFPPRNDEAAEEDDLSAETLADAEMAEPAEGEEVAPVDDNPEVETPKKRRISIDWAGLEKRVMRVPVAADNYYNLHATEDRLIYLQSFGRMLGRSARGQPRLTAFDLEDRAQVILARSVSGFTMAPDESKILASVGGGYRLFGTMGGNGTDVDTGGLVMRLDRAAEWDNIFDAAWRRFRDFFYTENMHGYDWAAVRERYRPLLAHVGHRADLNDLIGEMIAELNVSHAYIAGGDLGLPRRPRTGLLGARLELDGEGRYKIARIYRGEAEERDYRSPLDEYGINADIGDYVIAIDGITLDAETNPYSLLAGTAGRVIELTLSGRADGRDARTILIQTLRSERSLQYLEWVRQRRAIVDAATEGRVGYLHLPDMGPDGLAEFIKWYYGQTHKEGLIIDVRGNGGGNVSQMIIGRLNRELLGLIFARNLKTPRTYPSVVFTGPKVALIDENAGSDGDLFAAAFRSAELGPLIGKRSWGGVIGITDHGPLIDGGRISVPEFGNATPTGEWAIEGRGVEPDIEVDNDPASLVAGADPQLERAIREIEKRLKGQPQGLPGRPSAPIKTP